MIPLIGAAGWWLHLRYVKLLDILDYWRNQLHHNMFRHQTKGNRNHARFAGHKAVTKTLNWPHQFSQVRRLVEQQRCLYTRNALHQRSLQRG